MLKISLTASFYHKPGNRGVSVCYFPVPSTSAWISPFDIALMTKSPGTGYYALVSENISDEIQHQTKGLSVATHSRSARSFATGMFATLGVLLLLAGATLSLGTRAIFDAEFFADRLADSLSDERTAAYVATKLTDATIEANPDLILVRPLIISATKAVVTSSPFKSVVHQGAKRSHQLLATKSGQDVLLSVSDFGLILQEALADRPELAAMVPDNAVVVLGSIQKGPVLDISQKALNYGKKFGRWSRAVFLVGSLFLIISVLMATRQELVLLRVGIAVTSVAAITLLGFELGTGVVARIPADPALGQAMAGVWSTFVEGFWPRILILGSLGVLMMAAATAFLELMNLESVGAMAHRILVQSPKNSWLRLARGLFLILIGVLTVLDPTRTIRLAVGIAGGVICFVGLRELSRLAVDPTARLSSRLEQNGVSGQKQSVLLRRVPMGLVVIVVLVVGALFLVKNPEQKRIPILAGSENVSSGHAELHNRPLNEVVFACTHNAMGSADVEGWLFPNQQVSVRYQLQDGIRALMLDVLPGIPVGNAVQTDLAEGEISREKLEPILGAEGMEAALRIRERLSGAEGGESDLYLCHGLCELGAQLLVPVLVDIRDFLEANPQEVLIIIIEDTVPPLAIAEAFEESGLLELVWKGAVSVPWPTMGEMIQSRGRVLVLGEKHTEGVPWYHLAWDVCQETPYHFSSPEEFSNEPNRGGTDGSLLLMNHWVTTPPTSRPRDAALVNTRQALMERVEQCRTERGMTPNIIAVDFYRAGDLVGVVAELNGVDGSE